MGNFQYYLIRKSGILPILLILLVVSSACEKDPISPDPLILELSEPYIAEQRMIIFDLTNTARSEVSAGDLILDPELTVIAQAHARDMAERDFFSHVDPDGLTPFDRLARAGVEYRSAGENIAWYPSAESAVQGWIESPGHYENMIRTSFGKVGIGVYKPDPEDPGNFFYVQLFTD